MKGDFSQLGELECTLPRDLIFRWAWESLREAIGPQAAEYFLEAAEIMNVGAQNTGLLVHRRSPCGFNFFENI